MKKEMKNTLIMIGIVISTLLLMKVLDSFIAERITGLSRIKMEFLAELVSACIVVGVMIVLKRSNVMKLTARGFGEGLLAGMIYIVLNGYIYLIFLIQHDPITVSATDRILYVVTMLLIGITEEILFRGLLQNQFHRWFGENSKKNIILGILSSSAVFGGLHFMNLTAGANITSVSVQAVTAVLAGYILGVCYYRSKKNIWVCILIHAYIDGAGLLSLLSGANMTEAVNTISAANLISLVIYGSAALIISGKICSENDN